VDVLVLGGTVFLGRAVVAEALALGARVTTFNRGLSGSPAPGVEQITGDRTQATDLDRLAGRRFDVVVDTSGYVAADVARSAERLAPAAGHYAFVSTINVFPGWPEQADYRAGGVYPAPPDAARADFPADLDPGQSYGWLKAGAESAVRQAFGPERSSLLRAGLIVGPYDNVGRLPWWIDRVARGGEVLVPGTADDPFVAIDARDLARFALRAVPGALETTGPAGRDTRGSLMATIRATTGADAGFCYVGDDWLAAQGVEAWTEVPLWSPDSPGLWAHDGAPAQAAGLVSRPLRDTVADTWAWMRTIPGGWRPSERTPGLTPIREAELLAAWQATGAAAP
jgi:2'-hydroxyisoflavone reductase